MKEFCRLFEFDERQVRFVLEQGFVPKGIEKTPSTGDRREFGPRQAFCLAITVLLSRRPKDAHRGRSRGNGC